MTRPVFMFPGQGNLDATAARELLRNVASVRDSVEEASERSGIDLVALLHRGAAAQVNACDVAQVAIFALCRGLWDHLRALGMRPWGVMGHSAGEYAALVAAGILDADTALGLVIARGRAMTMAASRSPGAMAAVGGLPVGIVHEICGEVPGCAVANENSPIQTVISGTPAAIEQACRLARQRGALRVDRLVVGGAFHSPLMAPAGEEMARLLRPVPLRTPRCVFVSSITGGVVEDVEEYRNLLCEQITRPVRWADAVATMRLHGAASFVEVGPGRVLSALLRSCDRSAQACSVRELIGRAPHVSGAPPARAPMIEALPA